MDGAGRRPTGGILSISEALDDPEFCEAVEHELISQGLRLRWLCDGTDRLNWRDLGVVIRQAGESSAVARHSLGEAHGWGVAEHLLAAAVDALNAANWQRSGRGSRPQPVERPKVGTTSPASEPDAAESQRAIPAGDPFKDDESGTFTGVAIPVDELNRWLGWTD